MNRGNLAEDPKAGLSSSSRYSRNGGEKNSLLYVDSSSLRKERKAAGRKAGNQASAIKGDHNSKRKKSVGRGLIDSHMDRLEVGSDGRLFQVKESPATSEQKAAPEKAAVVSAASSAVPFAAPSTGEHSSSITNAQVQDIRPAIAAGVVSDAQTTADHDGIASDVREPAPESASSLRAKPERSYLTQKNPLLGIKSEARRERGTEQNPLLVDAKAGQIQEQQKERAAHPALAAVRAFLYRFRIPIIASTVALASAGYGYAAYHYSNRFYPGTEFFGIPAAEQSVYDVKAAVKAKVDSYSLQLVTRNPQTETSANGWTSITGENVIAAEDVNMIYRDNGEIDQAMKRQKSWAWPVMMIASLIGKGESSLETSYDSSMVSEALGSLECMQKSSMIKPQDAQVVLTDDGATVQAEIYGTTLNEEKTEKAVRKALDEGSTVIDLDDLGLYENPKVYSSDLSLITDAMAMNRVLGAKVLLRFGNRTEVINSEVIATFLDKEDYTYTLNEEKVRKYVEKLARKYDTYQCRRVFFTSIGTKFTLEKGVGDYGWQMDQDATYESILDAIRGQKKTTIEPVYTQEAYCRDANDIGDTYVEISLTNQTMWFYKNGKLIVETPVVTGNPYAGHETPSGGVWSLKGKMRNQTLSGQGYSSPVDYWMPFNNGVGIHDMQSRAWFGGTIYLGSGSHGCVNTPLSAVKLIYDQIEEGVPIVVYKDESDEALALVTDPVDVQTLTAQIEENYGTVEDDGVGSIVAWSRSQAAQAAAAAAQAAAAGTSGGTSVS